MNRNRSAAAIAAASLLALAAAGCGSTKPGYADQALNAKVPASLTAATPAPAAPKSTGKPPVPPAPISTDLKKKPSIPKASGDQPTTLVSKDIVTGSGPAAKKGDNVTVKYVGVNWIDDKQFDASWDRSPNTFPFQLGAGAVIPGWDQGVVGMKAGGRRELSIPPPWPTARQAVRRRSRPTRRWSS